MGPSGVGKDTLIDGLRRRFSGESRVHFAVRAITRPAGDESESHLALTVEGFQQEKSRGAFSVTWEANGLNYGLPRSLLDEVARGNVVIANGSRGALPKIRAAFPALTVVAVTVSADELARRLRSRGRETDEEIEARLARNSAFSECIDGCILIDNSGPPADAVEVLAGVVLDRLP